MDIKKQKFGVRFWVVTYFFNLGHPPFFRLLSNTFPDFGSVCRLEKKKKGQEKYGEEVWN